MTPREPHRREGRRRGLLGVAGVGAALATVVVIDGVKVRAQGNDHWMVVVLVGVAILVSSLAVLGWVDLTWRQAQSADALETPSAGAALPPFGARPRGDGVVLRPRAAIRLLVGVLPPMAALTALGLWGDGLPAQAALVGGLALALVGVWWRAHRYELCLDRHGIWRRRRPRWRLAWSDLQAVTQVKTSNRWQPDTPPDLLLHGRVTTPGGRSRGEVRLRCNLLAISPPDLRRMIDGYAGQAVRGTASPFLTWS